MGSVFNEIMQMLHCYHVAGRTRKTSCRANGSLFCERSINNELRLPITTHC